MHWICVSMSFVLVVCMLNVLIISMYVAHISFCKTKWSEQDLQGAIENSPEMRHIHRQRDKSKDNKTETQKQPKAKVINVNVIKVTNARNKGINSQANHLQSKVSQYHNKSCLSQFFPHNPYV